MNSRKLCIAALVIGIGALIGINYYLYHRHQDAKKRNGTITTVNEGMDAMHKQDYDKAIKKMTKAIKLIQKEDQDGMLTKEETYGQVQAIARVYRALACIKKIRPRTPAEEIQRLKAIVLKDVKWVMESKHRKFLAERGLDISVLWTQLSRNPY